MMSESSARFYIAGSVDSAGKSIGKGVFAGQEYGAGRQIAIFERPLVGSLDTERLKDTCANCFVWTEGAAAGSRLYVKEGTKVQTCAGCKRFRYCSRECQKEAWSRGHKHECKYLRSLGDKDIPKAVLATMELLVRRKHGLISEQEWDMLCQLQPHIDDFKKSGKYGGIELMAMGTSQFSWMQNTFSKDFVAGMYARVLANSLTLITPTFDPLGVMLDPTLGHINHSCDPNVYVVMDGAATSIRSLKPIKKDEEIYISYVDTTNPYARRQSELSTRWFFTCRCTKCQNGPTLQEDNWAIHPKDLAKRWKEVAAEILQTEESAHDPASYVGDSEDEKRVAALQTHAFQCHEMEQGMADLTETIKTIEEGMRLCHESRLWPVFRQPYAALRDDLIVHLLSAGDHKTAWAHCAKRYRDILPKLYPEAAHPVRVVQTWQTAMLALYLASMDEQVAPGSDMALIAYMLISEVDHMAAASHGEQSAFAKSVRSKLGEIMTEMHLKVGAKTGETIANALPSQRKLLMEMGSSVPF